MKVEVFKNAREELMKRVEYRDSHLKNCLIALAIIFALGEGIEMQGAKAGTEKIFLYIMAYPVSLLFLTLYLKEESLIASLSAYIADLGVRYNAGKSEADQIVMWDNSQQLKDGLKDSMNYRFASTMLTFVVFPGIMVGAYFERERWEGTLSSVLALISTAAALFSCYWQICEYKKRA